MEDELKSLRIDRTKRRSGGPSKWARRWILGGIAIFLLLGVSRFAYQKVNAATEVEVRRVRSTAAAGAPRVSSSMPPGTSWQRIRSSWRRR
jgi:hypothetical protein